MATPGAPWTPPAEQCFHCSSCVVKQEALGGVPLVPCTTTSHTCRSVALGIQSHSQGRRIRPAATVRTKPARARSGERVHLGGSHRAGRSACIPSELSSRQKHGNKDRDSFDAVRPLARRRRSRRHSRKPQAASRSRGRQICFQGRRATQTFKAETFVREIDCPGGSAGHVPPTGHRKQVTAPCSLAGRVCVRTRSDGTCHISSLAWWVSPSGTSSETHCLYVHPCCCSSSPPRESMVQPKPRPGGSDDGRGGPISPPRYHEGGGGKGEAQLPVLI